MLRPLLALLITSPALLAGEVGPPDPNRPTPQSEYDFAQRYLDSQLALYAADVKGGRPKPRGVSPDDYNYVRFFTTFAVPEKWKWKGEEVRLREQCELSLPFVLNSTSSYLAGKFVRKARRVPDSDTLWVIDIRDFGWTIEDIDAVFGLQPYFLTPLVDGKNPNILFRADWFIVYATDNTKLDDRGIKTFPYYVLQYGLNKEPKDKFEFERVWDIDEERAEKKKITTGTLVDGGDSAVSRHTRQLTRLRTELGYFWYTKDVKSHDFDPDKVQSRDYVEDIFAKQADAGEYISSNKRNLQTYLLTAGNNDKFKRVEFGDPTVVQDKVDPYDIRVRTAKSCITCHAFGIIPYTNVFKELFAAGGHLYAKSKQLQEDLEGFYLSEEDGELFKSDNELFAAAVKKCNGLTPEDNLKAYLSVYDWYWNQKVSLEQAALEVGVGPEEYKRYLKGATTGRLVLLAQGKAMQREIWDSVNLGGYVQSVLLAKALGKDMEEALRKHAMSLEGPKNKQERVEGAESPRNVQKDPPTPPQPPYDAAVVSEAATLVDDYGRPVVKLGKGSRLTVTRLYPDGVAQIEATGPDGRVYRGNVYLKYLAPIKSAGVSPRGSRRADGGPAE
jgi:hypothetical protein